MKLAPKVPLPAAVSPSCTSARRTPCMAIDATVESFIFEITGASDKVEQFIALMLPLGLVEVARTGIAAIRRGPEGL